MPPLIAICGPTAVGKSSLALQLAEEYDGEIVSADSGQVYRFCDIGTAKPTAEERLRVPHHLIDILNPDQLFSVGLFVEKAREVIADIEKRGKIIFLVGGTGLYLRALFEGLSSLPSRQVLREELELIASSGRLSDLYDELKQVDPKTAGRIKPGDRQRIVRALEVFRATGHPLSSLQGRRSSLFSQPLLKIGLSLERTSLYNRINERVKTMFERGWVQETEKLIDRWGDAIAPLKLIGYREIATLLKGTVTLDETIRLVCQKTRNYAKRQLTWFRTDPEIHWHEPSESSLFKSLIDTLLTSNASHATSV